MKVADVIECFIAIDLCLSLFLYLSVSLVIIIAFSLPFSYIEIYDKNENSHGVARSLRKANTKSQKSRLFKFFLFIKVTEAICLQKIDSQCMKRRQQLLNVADKVNIGHVSLETFVLKARR